MPTTMAIDITTPAEYEAVLSILPLHLRDIVEENITQIEELVLDLHQNFGVKYDKLRIDYPVEITKNDLKTVKSNVGKFRDDGRQGIPGTLHRISGEFDEDELLDHITIRVARVTMFVAEVLRDYIEAARGILVIGPPAVGKTTLLRDIARIRGELLQKGLVVLDSSNEITGDGDRAHHFLRRVRRIKVGDPSMQSVKLQRIVRNRGPTEVLMDEVGYNDDVGLLAMASKLGITAIATLHGETLKVTFSNDVFFPLLGLVKNEMTGVITKVSPPCFSLAIVVVAKGRYIVYPDLDASVTELLNGGNPAGIKVGNWPELQEAPMPLAI